MLLKCFAQSIWDDEHFSLMSLAIVSYDELWVDKEGSNVQAALEAEILLHPTLYVSVVFYRSTTDLAS
jgi:hypothetical protein